MGGSCVIRMLHGWIGEEVREGGKEGRVGGWTRDRESGYSGEGREGNK